MNRKIDTNWLGNGTEKSEKGKILELIADKSALSDLKSISTRADAARAQIKTLEADSTFSSRLSLRREQMIDLTRDQEVADQILKSLNKTEDEGKANWLKWENFNKNYLNKLHHHIDGTNNAITKLEDNLYTMDLGLAGSYDTNEELGAQRIANEICYQISKIDTVKLRELKSSTKKEIKDKLASDRYNNTINSGKIYKTAVTEATDLAAGTNDGVKTLDWIEKLEEYLKVIKIYVDSMTKRNFQGVDYREFAEKEMKFDFAVVQKVVKHLKADGSGDAINLINELGKWKDIQPWYIWSVKLVSEEEKARLIKNKTFPHSFKNLKIYWGDRATSKHFNVKGLKEWFGIYDSIFNNSNNVNKFTKSQAYIKIYNEMVAGLIYDKGSYNEKEKTWDEDLKNEQFHQDYTIQINDENGQEIQRIDAAYNLPEQVREQKELQTELKARKEDLGKSDQGTADGRAQDEHEIKIRAQAKILEELDKEIDKKVARESIKAKQKKLTSLNSKLTKKDLDWNNDSIILDALKAKKLLLDIAWMQNRGSDSISFREDIELGITKEIVKKNNDLLIIIGKKQGAETQVWNLAVKREFESKGNNVEERIKKTQEEEREEGVGMRETEAAFRSLGDKKSIEIANKINEAFRNATISHDSPVLSESDLDWALGITGATAAMVTDWGNLPNGFGKNKNKINNLVKDYNENDTKRKALMTFVNGLNYSEVTAAATDEDKFVAFKKRTAKEVIKDILKHENQDAIKDNPVESKKQEIADRMKVASGAGYNVKPEDNTFNLVLYGNPEKPKEITSEQIINFLFDEKMESFTPQSEKWSNTKTENAFVKHMKDYWPYYALTLVGVAILLIAVFWKTFSEWWNGPTEEGSEVEKNQEEEDKE